MIRGPQREETRGAAEHKQHPKYSLFLFTPALTFLFCISERVGGADMMHFLRPDIQFFETTLAFISQGDAASVTKSHE